MVVDVTRALIKNTNMTSHAVIHLDHGPSLEVCKQAVDAGFDSVMYDGSSLDIKENIKNTKTLVAYASKKDVDVEAEVGVLGEKVKKGEDPYASLEDVLAISKTGIDLLAVAIGNAHGFYEGKVKLNISLLKQFHKALDIPLVLHGGSFIPSSQVKQAIKNGISKINIGTESQEVYAQEIRKYIEEEKDLNTPGGYDSRYIQEDAINAQKKLIKEKIILFGSKNKI